MAALRQVGKVVVGMVPVVQLARLGLPALVALFALAVLVLAVICWILSSGERCERVYRMLLAARGNSSALTTETATPPMPAPHLPRGWSWRRQQRLGSRPGPGEPRPRQLAIPIEDDKH
jgi:hypothetical protein